MKYFSVDLRKVHLFFANLFVNIIFQFFHKIYWVTTSRKVEKKCRVSAIFFPVLRIVISWFVCMNDPRPDNSKHQSVSKRSKQSSHGGTTKTLIFKVIIIAQNQIYCVSLCYHLRITWIELV